jgi:hypothetical protein
MNKLSDVLLPSLMSFGPIFMVIGVPTNPASYCVIIGALMMSFGGSLLIVKLSRLEKRVKELEDGPK